MAKPTLEDTRWAVTAGGVESTLVSDPDGPDKNIGYVDDAIPSAKNFNWLRRKTHSWFQFLDPLFDSLANLTLPVNRGVQLSGTGDVFHGDRIRMFNGCSAVPATNVTQSTAGSSTGVAAATFTIPLDGFMVGDRLKSVTFKAKGSGAGTMTSQLATGSGTTSSSVPAQSGSGASVSNPVGSDTDYTLTITSPTTMTAALGAWFLTVQIASAGTLAITNIRATYDRPPP